MKTDFKKQLPAYKARRGVCSIVELPAMNYLMLDGEGDPNTAAAYGDALQALYPLAYALKFLSKNELGRDHIVPPLEALWWADNMAVFTDERDKSQWQWTVMLMVPDWLSEADVARCRLVARKKSSLVSEVRFGALSEGTCVQTLHVGPFDDEGPLLRQMHDVFIPENGLTMTGKHHEIYLSDPRRAAPENLRTILRQPVGRTRDLRP